MIIGDKCKFLNPLTSNDELNNIIKVNLDFNRSDWDNEMSNMFFEEYHDWQRNFGDEDIHRCLKNIDTNVRLQILSALVVSKKTTLNFTPKELEYLQLFIDFNVHEKFEYVPLFKKAFARIKASSEFLQKERARKVAYINITKGQIDELKENTEILKNIDQILQHYARFQTDVQNLCKFHLRPSSTYTCTRNCLEILLLDKEFLGPSNMMKCKTMNSRILDVLLLDTYECNKDMAYQLLKGVRPDDVERGTIWKSTTKCFKLAIELGNSKRPIDSVTAAYILKYIMDREDILTAVEFYTIVEQRESGYRENIISYYYIKILLKLLQDSLYAEDIVDIIIEHALYGYLYCIRQFLYACKLTEISNYKTWKNLVEKLIKMCFLLSEKVSEIVNNSSPEGHLPMDLSQITEDFSITPQMILLCSWRTIKEISLIFGYLVQHVWISDADDVPDLVSKQQVTEIGEHFVKLLIETKHRGAFEQAHVGFEQVCKRLWSCKSKFKDLPKIWLHQILLAIAGFGEENSKVCATRRSAGVPFMVQALLSTQLTRKKENKNKELVFHSVMKILLSFVSIESEEYHRAILDTLYEDEHFAEFKTTRFEGSKNKTTVSEIKTHALNILRALFRHSQLGEVVKEYVADGIIAAIKSYDGATWAERNAATLLFSALIVRIFGVQRTKDQLNLTYHNQMTVNIFFDTYPSLYPFLCDQLRAFVSGNERVVKPSIHSILLLLSRLYVKEFHEGKTSSPVDNAKVNEIIGLVSKCGGSQVYETRKLAARALVPLIDKDHLLQLVADLCVAIESSKNRGSAANLSHGYMLQLLEIVKKAAHRESFTILFDNEKFRRFLQNNTWILDNIESKNSKPASFPLAATFLEICTILIDAWKCPHFKSSALQTKESYFPKAFWDPVFSKALGHLRNRCLLKQRPGVEAYEEKASDFFRSFIVIYDSPSDIHVCREFMQHPNAEVQKIIWNIANYISTERSYIEVYYLFDQIISLDELTANVDPEVRSVTYSCISQTLKRHEQLTTDLDELHLCAHYVLLWLKNTEKEDRFQISPEFLKLLGTAYSVLSQEYKDKSIPVELKRDIYRTMFDNSSMDEADFECRKAVAEVFPWIFKDFEVTKQDTYITLYLWTTFLNLLLDDSKSIRDRISDVPWNKENECIEATVKLFFEKFHNYIASYSPSVACAAYFTWAMKFANDDNFEMNDGDVFDKCRNYEYLDPLKIASVCSSNTADLFFPPQYLSPDTLKFSPEIRQWLSEQLNLSTEECKCAKDLFQNYSKHISKLRFRDDDVLKPTFKSQFIQLEVYKKFTPSNFTMFRN